MYDLIEKLTAETNRLGPFLLWKGYGTDGVRSPGDVCITKEIGLFLMGLVKGRNPRFTVEIGAGFGVSGMCLAAMNKGLFMSWEANTEWAEIARSNISQVGRVMLFPEPFDPIWIPDEKIDIAFIDAIHTEIEVSSQFEAIMPLMNKNGIILIDDIEAVQSWFDGISYTREILFNRLGVIDL